MILLCAVTLQPMLLALLYQAPSITVIGGSGGSGSGVNGASGISGSGPSVTSLILTFDRPVTPTDIDKFENLGGVVSAGPWNHAAYGFSGYIGGDEVSLLEQALPGARIERNSGVKTSLNLAATQVGARSTAWSSFGVNGSSNASIAMLDTGINASHEAFGGLPFEELNWNRTLVGWNDFIGGSPYPYDDNGHGTFVAGVVSSEGTSQVSADSLHAHISKNISHLEVFPDGKFYGTHRVKVATFELTHTPDEVIVNTSYAVTVYGGSVSEVGFSLQNAIGLRNYTLNENQEENYTLTDYSPIRSMYDIYLNYTVGINTNATFNVTLDFWWEGEYKSTDGYDDLRGVAPGSKLVSLKIADENGRGNVSSIISALDWILANRSKFHVSVACLSLEDDDPFDFDGTALSVALNNTINGGILVVMAAGNGGLEREGTSFLNKMVLDERVIVVGATNDRDQVTYYSAQGGKFNGTGSIKPDLVAPGGSFLPQRSSVFGPSAFQSNDTTVMTGTSISASIVAAALNLMVEAAGNWTNWNNSLDEQKVRDFKALLLMTCTETNPGTVGATNYREDNPYTDSVDEGLPQNSPTFDSGGKDPHEGYGRLNIPAALEAINSSLDEYPVWAGTLASSVTDPTGIHASARRVVLKQYHCYNFSVTQPAAGANFQVYLYKNSSDANGDPVLLGKSVPSGTLLQSLYYCPDLPDQEYILVVKAITGSGAFVAYTEEMPNDWSPSLGNVTIESSSPSTNTTYDTWTFSVNYTDPDNNPPMYIRANITRDEGDFSQNFTMAETNSLDINYTDGKEYSTSYEFYLPGNYTIWVEASDGANTTSTSKSSWKFEVNSPPSYQFPYTPNFHDAGADENWTSTTGWVFHQVQDASGRDHDYWHCSNFDVNRVNWTYDNNLDANLYSPYIYLNDTTNPVLQIGMRVSVNTGDSFRVYLRTNNSATWQTLYTFVGPTQQDWFQELYNLSQYKGDRVQVRFRFQSDNATDYVRNKGAIVNDFQVKDFVNTKGPEFNQPSNGYFSPDNGTRFSNYQVRVLYYHEEGISPTTISATVNGVKYTLLNLEGKWDCSLGNGVLYGADVTIEHSGRASIQFEASDGNNSVQSAVIQGPEVFSTRPVKQFPWSSDLWNPDVSEYNITGIPNRYANNEWLETATSWNHVVGTSEATSYFYCAEITDIAGTGQYGTDWDTRLILPTVYLDSPHQCLLSFTHSIYIDQIQGDYGIVEISKDFGDTWTELVRFGNTNQTGQNLEFRYIDIGDYNHYNVTVRFRFVSDGYSSPSTLPGAGWKVRNITIGAFLELQKPTILMNDPVNGTAVKGKVLLNFSFTDNVGVNPNRVFLFINNVAVDVENDNESLVYLWDTWAYPNGNTTVRVVVEDLVGNTGSLDLKFVITNPLFDYILFLQWLVALGVVVVASLLVYKFGYLRIQDKKEQERIRRERMVDAHGILPSESSRIEQIDEILRQYTPEIEDQMPYILYCKKCHTWYKNDEFEWICPKCNSDTLFLAKKCIVCDKWYFFDGPGSYFCTNGGCNRILVRDPDMLEDFIVVDDLDEEGPKEIDRGGKSP
ncbi:MAG: S8 family serine peptidase [Promethearchaeota archaeon]